MAFIGIMAALFIGIFTGIITGLTPGVHVNLVAVLVLSLSSSALSLMLGISPILLAVFLISLAITHSFLDSLPSIYLGAPDEAQALNVLPGHRMLMRGKGHQAVLCTAIGSLGALLLSTALLPLFIIGMGVLSPIVQPTVGYLLIVIVMLMIAREKKKWLKSLALFLLAGVLGLLVLTALPMKQPLLPLLSGLFGFSILLYSLFQRSVIPPQQFSAPLELPFKNTAKAVSAASGMGFIAAFLPGFGNAQAAIVATTVVKDIGDEGFLTMVGGINTASMLISIGTAFAIDKARNGAIVAVKELLGLITLENLLLFIGVSLAAGGIAVMLTIISSKVFARYIVKVNYRYIVYGIVAFVSLLTAFFDGFLGITVLLTATAIGLLASFWGVGKNHLMGCLLLPVILFFVL